MAAGDMPALKTRRRELSSQPLPGIERPDTRAAGVHSNGGGPELDLKRDTWTLAATDLQPPDAGETHQRRSRPRRHVHRHCLNTARGGPLQASLRRPRRAVVGVTASGYRRDRKGGNRCPD
jgi:hypothetical protein